MDWSVLHTLNLFLFHHDGVEDPLRAYVVESRLLFFAVVIALALFPRGPARRELRRGAVTGAVSAGLALVAAWLLAGAVGRARPFVAHPGAVHLFARHAADPGFPSDHATASFAIAVALLLRDRRWGVAALVAATLLCVGRVALGLHYPTDVMAGAALGSLMSLLLWRPAVRAPLDRLTDRAGAGWDDLVSLAAGRRLARHR